MWGRLFFGLVLMVAIVSGYPYAALLLNTIIGTSTVVFNEADGTQRALIMGPDAPQPNWLPMLPRAVVVTAGHWVPSPGREIAGDVELLTHKGVDEIKTFYLQQLRAAGFDIRDLGYGTLNAPVAAYLGIDNMLQGYRNDTGVMVAVTTRSSSGLVVPSRIVQVRWQKIDKARMTEWMAAGPSPSPSR